ncbi:MAG: hypothetical protein V4515_05530 [Chloroflexota bacterium]
MTASEFAFLALGLVLGVASGAALVMVLGSRPPAREVRLTVGHDAVPRRAATLSSDAFITSPAEPARGGPADRRLLDRSAGPSNHPEPGGPAMPDALPNPARAGLAARTSVLFGGPATARAGIPIEPERDPALDALRVQAAKAAAQLFRADLPVFRADLPAATAVLAPDDRERIAPTSFLPSASDAPRPRVFVPEPLDETPALTRILRGDHHALYAITAALAGVHVADRRSWETAIRSMTDSIVAAAITEGWLDFPVGNPFWDTFTIAQCRAIAGALATTGHRFDGIDGWAESRIPSYRDLTIAVADAGLEPRRIRAWPTQEEIGDLYLEVTAAPDEYLATHAPHLELEEVHALVGVGGSERARLWAEWDRVRAIMTAPVVTA